jgi:hypothetical protein
MKIQRAITGATATAGPAPLMMKEALLVLLTKIYAAVPAKRTKPGCDTSARGFTRVHIEKLPVGEGLFVK